MPKFAMRCSFGIYVFFLGCVHVYGQNCPPDSVGHTVYGPGCKYLCHCYEPNEQCNRTTGRCASGCANEWMGPGCQYRNILWRKFTNQFDRQNARQSIDGNVHTCSRSFSRIGPIWWRAWFEQYEMIRGLTFITEEAHLGSFKRFTVYVEKNSEQSNDTGFQQQDICYKHNGVSSITTTMTVICYRPLWGNQIRIQLASTQTHLVLCDVRAFGGRNLAYAKQTSQSNNFEKRISSNAVDGSIESSQCALTKSVVYRPHVWTVNLGNVVHVEALQLIELHQFQKDDIIQAGNNSHSYSIHFNASINKVLSFTLDETFQHLQFKRRRGYIALCEVFVFGDCLDNVCGLNCNISCHCAVFTFENKVSGECLEGCAAGWTGHGRRCDTECPDDKYGPGCHGICNKQDGSCIQDCSPGWKGERCEEECSAGTFGVNCSGKCRNCLEYTDCSKVDGHCPRGCAAGWMGNKCDRVCVEGRYGPNCNQMCSKHCSTSRVCNKTDGRCVAGCEPGWDGPTCYQECDVGFYGTNCDNRCSIHCRPSSICNKTSGHCSACSQGWTGPKCDNECPEGKYGYLCYYNCSGYCLNDLPCNKTNGHCDGGCSPGWIGDMCNSSCSYWYYGYECKEMCSGHCVDSGQCDHVNGHCPRGCAAGWIGDKCDKECPNASYGANCSDRCSSNCQKEKMCDKKNGTCEGGCKAGWQGLTCLTECNNDTYGAECSKQCSGHCMYNDVCDKVDGRCHSGCAAGWMGDQCDAECSNGTFGMGCSHSCSGHCADGEACNKTDGHCDGGCETGWQGSLCENVVLSVQDEHTYEPVVVGTIVALLALLGVLTVVAYRRFYIPSRRNKRRQEPVRVQSSDETAYVNRMIASGLDSVDRLALRNITCDNADQSRQQHAAAIAQDVCEYYNLVEGTAPIVKMPEHGILLANLIRFLEDEKHDPGKLAAEFAQIPTIAEHSCLEAQRSSNKHKNRYQQMYPYDHNRVILHTVGSDPSSDYINASHIDGYKLRDAFIAAQGTTKENIGDFWRLIWEKKIKVIVMLTELYEQGKMKCEQYWDSTGPITFGDITVTVLSEEQFAEFTIRTFLAKYVGNKSPLLVQQYHYTAWPDKSCPDGTASLLCFWGRVNKNNPKSDTPWLVHCSAGVGRTGTFIALDILISQGRDTGYVDVYGCVEALRQQRVFMVQTKGQYIYLHELLADALVLHSLPASTDEFLRLTSSGASALDHAWNAVKVHMMVGDNGPGSDSRSKSGVMKENRHKNRFEYIVPDDQYRPYLSMTSDGSSNYINAVYMPSYRRKHGLILTQAPLPTTTADWWRLVLQTRIQTVLAFDDTPTSENIGSCFPMDRKLKNGQFQTRQMSFEQDRGFTITKHNLIFEEESRELTYLQYQEWRNNQLVPSDSVTMLDFCQEVLALQNQRLDSPLLIQCFDGATRSGLMAVLLNALDRLCVEKEVAVLQILHHLRLRRPQIVPNKEQLQFCYDVIRHHLQEGSTYANL